MASRLPPLKPLDTSGWIVPHLTRSDAPAKDTIKNAAARPPHSSSSASTTAGPGCTTSDAGSGTRDGRGSRRDGQSKLASPRTEPRAPDPDPGPDSLPPRFAQGEPRFDDLGQRYHRAPVAPALIDELARGAHRRSQPARRPLHDVLAGPAVPVPGAQCHAQRLAAAREKARQRELNFERLFGLPVPKEPVVTFGPPGRKRWAELGDLWNWTISGPDRSL